MILGNFFTLTTTLKKVHYIKNRVKKGAKVGANFASLNFCLLRREIHITVIDASGRATFGEYLLILNKLKWTTLLC